MKQITFSHLQFTTDSSGPMKKTYSQLVKETSQLINKSYPATLNIVSKFEPGELQALYDESLSKWRNDGFNSPAHYWWTKRGNKMGKTWVQ